MWPSTLSYSSSKEPFGSGEGVSRSLALQSRNLNEAHASEGKNSLKSVWDTVSHALCF